MATILTPDEWLQRIGDALRQRRLRANLGQAELAAQAGLSRSAVQNLEAGRGTLETLVRALRTLGREDWLQSLIAVPTVNPLHVVRSPAGRQRASGSRRGRTPPSP